MSDSHFFHRRRSSEQRNDTRACETLTSVRFRRRPQHYKQEKLVERSSDFDGEEIIDSEIAKMDTPYYNLIPPLAQSEEFEPMSPGNLTKN